MVELIPLDALLDADQEALVKILNEDALLNDWLGTVHGQHITLAEFKQTGADWQRTRNATTYCIWTGQPVGTISISHRQPGGKARIGYWLASSEWGKGIASEAFQKILEIARRQGILQVSATIERRNIASLHMWRRCGAAEEPLDEGHVRVLIDIQATKKSPPTG